MWLGLWSRLWSCLRFFGILGLFFVITLVIFWYSRIVLCDYACDQKEIFFHMYWKDMLSNSKCHFRICQSGTFDLLHGITSKVKSCWLRNLYSIFWSGSWMKTCLKALKSFYNLLIKRNLTSIHRLLFNICLIKSSYIIQNSYFKFVVLCPKLQEKLSLFDHSKGTFSFNFV